MKAFLFFLLSGLSIISTAQQWQWARQYRWASYNDPRAMAVDLNENVIVCGEFYNNQYPQNGFIIKYDKFGNKLWDVFSTGGALKIKTIAADSNNDIYLGGSFEGSVSFAGTTLISKGDEDIVLVKLNSSGVLQWIKTSGTPTVERINSITLTSQGTILATGNFYDTLYLSQPKIIAPSNNLFLASITSSGQVLWIKNSVNTDSIPTYSGAVGEEVIEDPQQNIFVISAINGNIKLDTTHITDGLATRIIKFDSVGNFLWSKHISSGIYEYSKSLIPSSNFVYIIKTNSNGRILQKYDQLGSFVWQRNISPTDDLFRYHDQSVYMTEKVPNSICKIKPVECVNSFCDSFLIDHTGSRINSFPGGLYITGRFHKSSVMEFGNDTLRAINDTWTFYIAKFSLQNNPVTTSVFEKSSFKVYPNPSTGLFTISNPNTGNLTICIYDVLGNCILDKTSLQNNEHHFDLNNQPKGIYFVEIISDHQKTVKKISLQ